ncbi:hypothetical protein AK830_g11678 [Neonectria ditissima]|uniref:Uncharacterized protein n=1 Tax=Neonectria ditissima TaxID=78410 RepID=A0A0P7ALP4_9HYPO|nr:hypothetical protein AK830_g11678 [Neonectria ditissima]
MPFSLVNPRKGRWQMDARHADGITLPPWTRADESDHEDYDAAAMKRRKMRPRNKRHESQGPMTEPNVRVSPSSSSTPALRKRQSDIPGNSLRETTIEASSQTAIQSASQTATQSSASQTATETGARIATPTASGTTKADPDETAGSDSDGYSDSASESEDDKEEKERKKEKDDAVQEAITSAPSSTADATLSGSESMISAQDGLHSDVHKILLSVGSVVGMILIIGVCIIAWKMRKRSHRRRVAPLDDMSFHKPSRFDKILAKVPFIRTRLANREWYTIEDPSRPTYEKTQATKPPRFASPRIESQFFAPDKPMGVYSSPRLGLSRSKSPIDTFSPTSATFVESTAVQVQVMSKLEPKQVRLSASGKAMPTTPKWTFGHSKRQTGVSELSSISSGFGDGDIIITPSNTNTVTTVTVPSPAVAASRQSSMHSSRRDARRDTASTDVSLDARPRFHSVNSWVKQQTGHMRREQQHGADGDAPPVPMLPPPEQKFGLMMPDGEVPRRVDM